MSLKPIEYTDLSIKVYEQIKEMILSGELEPGQKLPQEKIAASLGVSRMPLHKAFVMLEDEFLVESIPRRGIFIRKTDLKEIIDAFECREGLEGVAARNASMNLTSEEINRMEALFIPFTMENSFDHVKYQQADQRFHEEIILASGNSIMQKLNNIGNVLIRTYPKGIILPFRESLADHSDIIRAFRDRDPDQAEQLIRMHSRKARRILEEERKKELKNLHKENEQEL